MYERLTLRKTTSLLKEEEEELPNQRKEERTMRIDTKEEMNELDCRW